MRCLITAIIGLRTKNSIDRSKKPRSRVGWSKWIEVKVIFWKYETFWQKDQILTAAQKKFLPINVTFRIPPEAHHTKCKNIMNFSCKSDQVDKDSFWFSLKIQRGQSYEKLLDNIYNLTQASQRGKYQIGVLLQHFYHTFTILISQNSSKYLKTSLTP